VLASTSRAPSAASLTTIFAPLGSACHVPSKSFAGTVSSSRTTAAPSGPTVTRSGCVADVPVQ
jgi:hypothetical protein